MGGTGAAPLALRYPDRFSAAAALAGYQSFFVRRDVLGHALRTWELTELSRWSPASFAENGRDLLFIVAQGTKDLPLSHSRSLAERYHALGYPLREQWPDIGHDVWRIVWGDAELWPTLSSRRATSNPSHITLKTDSLRLGSRAWATITALDASAAPAVLDATIAAKDRIVVRTKGADSFELRPGEAVSKGMAALDIDGQHLELSTGGSLVVHRSLGAWEKGPLPSAGGLAKRAAIEGPIRDAFNGPLAFVYGTLDPRQTRAAREVAEHFRTRWSGNTELPVLADAAFVPQLAATYSLFLVGSKRSNRLVRDLDSALPRRSE